MKIIWSPEALLDLHSLRNYIARDNPAAAQKVAATIFEYTARQLTEFPHSGREGRVVGTLELVIPKLPYIVPYRINENQLDIIRVYHAARRWPDQL